MMSSASLSLSARRNVGGGVVARKQVRKRTVTRGFGDAPFFFSYLAGENKKMRDGAYDYFTGDGRLMERARHATRRVHRRGLSRHRSPLDIRTCVKGGRHSAVSIRRVASA